MREKAEKRSGEETFKGSQILSLGKKRDVEEVLEKISKAMGEVESILEERGFTKGISRGTYDFLEDVWYFVKKNNRITPKQLETVEDIERRLGSI